MRLRRSSLFPDLDQAMGFIMKIYWLGGKILDAFSTKVPAAVEIPLFRGYFQREEDRRIRQKLKSLDKRRNVSLVKTLVLHGPAGHGKTYSAANLMNQLNTGTLRLRISGSILRHRPTILWTIHANNHARAFESYRSLAKEIGFPEEANVAKQELALHSRTPEGRQHHINLQSQCKKSAYDEALKQIYDSVMKNLKHHSSWVLLIEDPSEDMFWPKPGSGNFGNGLVIVTTQNSKLLAKEGGDYTLEEVKIGRMRERDAVKFLANKSDIRVTIFDKIAAKEIAVKVCQRVPKDIARFGTYVKMFKDETKKELNFNNFLVTENATVAECLLISEMARENQIKLLKFLACCSSENHLPLEILKRHSTEVAKAAKDSQFASISKTRDENKIKVVNIDQRDHDTLKNLLTRQEEPADVETWMDSFKHLFMGNLSPNLINIPKLSGLDVSQVINCLGSVCKDALQRCRDEDFTMLRFTLPHLKEAVELSKLKEEEIEPLAMAEGHACLGESLLFFGESKEATTQLETALDLYKNYEDPETVQLDFANVLHFLGEAYTNRHLGNPSTGESYLKDALRLKEKFYNGKADPQVAFTLRSLGNVLNELGKHSEAIDHIQRACEIYGDSENYRQEYGYTLSSLGSSFRYLGQYDQAERCLKTALQIFRSVKSPSKLRIGETLSRLSSVQRDMDKLGECTASLNEALEMFGYNNIYRAVILSKLSVMYRYKGMSEESLKFAKELKKFSDKQHGAKDHPAIATALLNLGHVQSDIGDVEEAERNLTRAMEIYVALHGKNHRTVAAALNYLGYVYQQMGMVQEGKEKLEDAVKIMKNSDFHPGTANSLKRLSKACMILGETVKSTELACTALKLYQETYENTMEHREVRKCKVRVAYSSSKIGLFEKAKEYLRVVEYGFPKEKLTHPEYAALLQKKTEVTLDSFEFDWPSDEKSVPGILSKANTDLIRAEKIVSNSLGRKHQQFAAIKKEQARLNILMGNYDDACREINSVIPNVRHHLKADFLLIKSDAEKKLEMTTAQKESLERAENIYRKMFGEDHPMLAFTLQKLCAANFDLEDRQNAYKYFEMSGQACERVERNLKEQRDSCDTDFLKSYNTDVHPIVKRQKLLDKEIRRNQGAW